MFENIWDDDEDDEELKYIYFAVSRCPACKLCFETGCVLERWGCTEDICCPMVYVKKGTQKELLYDDPARKLTDKILKDEYDAVCLCKEHTLLRAQADDLDLD